MKKSSYNPNAGRIRNFLLDVSLFALLAAAFLVILVGVDSADDVAKAVTHLLR